MKENPSTVTGEAEAAGAAAEAAVSAEEEAAGVTKMTEPQEMSREMNGSEQEATAAENGPCSGRQNTKIGTEPRQRIQESAGGLRRSSSS